MTNTKKKHGNKMKLMSAIGMLTVSAAMLVSSTFAWFSLNRNVSASTMTISAKSADPYLQISANGTTFHTELDTTAQTATPETGTWNVATAERLRLIAPKTIGTTMEWVWSSSTLATEAQGADISTAAAGKFLDVTLGNDTANADRSVVRTGTVTGDGIGENTDNFLLQQTLTFKNNSQSAPGTNLKIDSVTITKADGTTIGTNDFENSVRVLIVNESGAYALYDKSGIITSGAQNGASGTQMGGTGKNVIAPSLAANDTTSITIYMFFDGNDAKAFTENTGSLSNVKATFAFSIDPESTTNP